MTARSKVRGDDPVDFYKPLRVAGRLESPHASLAIARRLVDESSQPGYSDTDAVDEQHRASPFFSQLRSSAICP